MTKWDLRGMKAPRQTDEQLNYKIRAAENEVMRRMDPTDDAMFESYRHKRTGNHYIVTAVALDSYSLEPQVIYLRRDNPWLVFSRPVSEFLEKFERED